MQKQLSVNLSFTADVAQARQQVQSLQTQLTNLINAPVGLGQKMTSEIQQATHAAADLKVHLQNATNVNTGLLDFGKLTNSIKKSGMTVSEYGAKLQSMGVQGQQAFMSLANSVAASEVPLRRSSAALSGMLQTLKNTAKWQLSSMILHGFISGISDAYNYAQDLNESLNNIRIVTGYNVDQMSKFADEANKAAKALSTTTTEYTNASLIYYQQGLSDAEVKKRTDVTIKMANASRQSAEIVSDQLTAIWNNFDNGTQSLEYYADVVTALGAATASSSEEIADGLEKFAAVAETVGLSYEYATAALATVTATTRQSADVVGTAFKTLFARLNDLKLGETLEDGTTLGQYTENLAKIGVNIKDTSGQLKDMDQILEETAEKWDSLGRDQQTALAKGVAGIRQYTQFVALMDNWDFMKDNLATTKSAAGTLQDQADTYAESWEAANNRVKASAEAMYTNLIKDEFFIDLTNALAKAIDNIGDFVKSIGGLDGVLSSLGLIITKVFAKQMAQGFRNLAYNIQMSTEAGYRAVQAAKALEMDRMAQLMANNETSGIAETQAQSVYTQELNLQKELIANSDKLSAEEQQRYQILLDQHRAYGQQSIEIAKQIQLLQEQKDISYVDIVGSGMNITGKRFEEIATAMSKVSTSAEGLSEVDIRLQKIASGGRHGEKQIALLEQSLRKAGATDDDIAKLQTALQNIQDKGKKAGESITEIKSALVQISSTKIDNFLTQDLGLEKNSAEYKELRASMEQYVTTTRKAKVESENLKTTNHNLSTSFKGIIASIKNAIGNTQDFGNYLATMTSGLMSLGMLLSSINSLIDTMKSPDTSGWEKFTSVLISTSMILMSMRGVGAGLIAMFKLFKDIIEKDTIASIANAIAADLQAKAADRVAQAKARQARKTKKNADETNKDTAPEMANSYTTGTYKSGKRAGQQWYKKDGKFITKEAFDAKDASTSTPSTKGKGLKSIFKNFNAGTAKTLGTAAAGVAIVAASVAAAALIITKAVDYYNRYDIAAKKAAETAKKVNETAEQIKSTEATFQSHLSEYDSGVKALEKLTKGTEDYKDAVRKANDEALELLKTHKNLKYEINSEGLIVIDEEDLKTAKRESIAIAARAQATAMAAQQDADNAQLEADKINFQRTKMKTGGANWSNDDTTAVAGGVGAGAALAGGAVAYTAIAASNVWNSVGWAMLIAGAVSAVIGIGIAAFNNDADERESKTLDALEELSINSGGRDLTKEEIKAAADKEDPTGKLAESLLKDIDATNDMVEEMRKNTEAINRNNELIAQQLLQSNDYIQDSNYVTEIEKASGGVFGIAYNEALENIEKQQWGKKGISKADGANQEAKEVWKEYLKYAGLEGKNWQLVDTTGTDANRIFVYLDEQGQRQEKTLDEMIKARATYEANEKTNTNANELVGLFADLVTKNTPVSEGIHSFLTYRNFENVTQSGIEEIQNSLQTYGNDYAAVLRVQLGDLNTAAKQLGFESSKALVNAFKDSFNNINKGWKDIDLQGLSNDIAKNLSISSAQTLENTIKLMNSGKYGEQAGIDFVNGLNTILADVKPEDLEEILSKIVSIDFTQWNSGKQVIDILQKFGYELNVDDEFLQEWITNINIAMRANYDYAASLNEILKVRELIEDFTLGKLLTKEEYDLLYKYNNEIERYFRALGNGQYQLTGDPLDAKQIMGTGIDKAYEDKLRGANANYENIIKRQDVDNIIKNTGYTREQLSTSLWSDEATYTTKKVADPNFWDHMGAGYNNVIKVLGRLDFSNNWHTAEKQAKKGGRYHEEKVWHAGLINSEGYEAQLDFIEQNISGFGEDVQQWRKNFEAGKTTEDEAVEVAKVIENYLATTPAVVSGELETAAEAIKQYEQQKLGAEIDYAKTAKSSDELDQMYEQNQISEQAYLSAQQDWIMKEKWEGMDPDEVDEYAKHLMKAAENSELLYDSMDQEAAEDVALYTKKMNLGVQALAESFTDWNDILKKSDVGSEEYATAMNGMKNAMSNVLGVSEKFLSDDFILNNMVDIERAANGDAEAIDRLALAASRDIIVNLGISDQNILNEVLTLHDQLAAEIPDIKVGATIDDEEFMQKAAQIVEQAGMSVEQANAYFRSMGFEPHFETKKVKMMQSTKVLTTHTKVKKWGLGALAGHPEEIEQWTEERPGEPVETEMEVPALTTDEGKPNFTLTRTNAGSMNNFSSSNSGGNTSSGSSPKQADPVKKDDIVERYKELNDQLDDVAKKYDAASKAADRLYGPAKLAMMEKMNEVLEEEKDLLEQKRKMAVETYLPQDRQALNQAASAAGIQFKYDDKGNISNYTEQMTRLYNELNGAINSANADGNVTDLEQERIDAIQKKVDAVQDAVGTYDETLNEIEELDVELQEKLYEIQDNNYAQFEYKIDLQLELNERELKKIDHELQMIDDDFYKIAEVMALTSQKSELYGEGEKGILDDLNAGLKELEDMYSKGDISQSQFLEGLKKIEEQAYANQEALMALNEEMLSYYEAALQEGQQMFSDYVSEFDNLINTLDHYKNVMSLIGQDKDYDAMNEILQTRIGVLNDKVAATEAFLASYDTQIAEAEENIKNAATEDDKKYWEERLRTLNKMKADEQANLYSYLEQIGDAANEILSNSIEKAYEEAERAMTGGTTFDAILKDMERVDKIQEEFLTTTNKMYETNKLLSQAQLAIDKTSNTQAKEKYKQYMDYIEQLQISGNLSKQELKIAEAKYKVLEAEMALEEAKDAKSTVRLTRDSEGNFGYVYTANQDDVASATQGYSDAQNELYNIGLEGSQEYREKIIQTQQETLEELKQLEIDYRVNHLMSEEEYNQQRAHILETSNELLTTYHQSYQASQFTMANASYQNLIKEDKSFNNGQVSRNAEHYSLMEGNDADYYGGIKTLSSTTQGDLNKDLAQFGIDANKTLNTNYTEWGKSDEGYYTSLMEVFGKIPGGVDKWMNTGEGSTKSKLDIFYGHLDGAYKECESATETWKTNMAPVIASVGKNFDNPEDNSGLKQKIDNVKDSSNTLKTTLIGEDGQGGLVKSISDLWSEVETATTKWQLQWQELSKVNGEYTTLLGKIDELNGKEIKIPEVPTVPTIPNVGLDDTDVPGGTPSTGWSSWEDADKDGFGAKVKTKSTFLNTSRLTQEFGEDYQSYLNAMYDQYITNGNKLKVIAIGSYDKGYAAVQLSDKKWYTNRSGLKLNDIPTSGQLNNMIKISSDRIDEGSISFDTGGYTGEWGPDGKLAVLHQKELVLNAEDTENILNTVSFVRDLISSIDSSAMMSSLRDLFAYTATNNFGSNVEQDIKIYAEFPSATNHSEIEEAFNNLLNTASQYANRKN